MPLKRALRSFDGLREPACRVSWMRDDRAGRASRAVVSRPSGAFVSTGSVSRLETVHVLHRARLQDLRVLEALQLLDQAVADIFVVERPADDLGAGVRRRARRRQREEHDDRALEGAVVLLVEHVLVAAQRRWVALL